MEEKEVKRYHPQHPLPNEIKEMARDDTVCQFCGVSYLIHNEIKNLQLELDECKKEVERLRHYDEREKALIEQVNTLNAKLKDLLEKRHLEEEKCNEYEDLILQKSVSISNLKNNLEKYHEDLELEKKSNADLREKLSDVRKIASKVLTSRKVLHKQLLETSTFCQNSISELTNQWNKEKASVVEGIIQLRNLYSGSLEQVTCLKSDFSRQISNYEIRLQEDNEKCSYQVNMFENLLKYMKGYQGKIELYIKRFNKFEEKQSSLIEKYESQINKLVQKVNKFKIFFRCMINDKDSLDSIDTYKQENIILKDERTQIVNAHQHQIKQLHESFKQKLLDAEHYTGKLDEEMKTLLSKFDEEKRLLLEKHAESLNKASADSNMKHKQLNDNYEKSKREIKKLEEKHKLQQKKFAEEKTKLLQEITASYEKATTETESRYNQMNEEKSRNLQTIKKLEQHLESMQVKFHEEMLKQVEQHEKEKKSMEFHLSELSRQLEVKQKADLTNETKDGLQETIGKLQLSLNDSRCMLKEKSNSLKECEEELSTLRDCIRRECEERYELTEALAEARMELLSKQRFTEKSSSKQSLVYNRTSPQSRKLGEIPKSHEKLAKLKESSNPPCNLEKGKNSPINWLSTTGSSRSIKSNNSVDSSRYSKNKLKISLKNR